MLSYALMLWILSSLLSVSAHLQHRCALPYCKTCYYGECWDCARGFDLVAGQCVPCGGNPGCLSCGRSSETTDENIVLNGDFDTPDVRLVRFSDPTMFNEWAGDAAFFIASFGSTEEERNQALALDNGEVQALVSQEVPTTENARYQLRFSYAANPTATDLEDNRVLVYWNDEIIGSHAGYAGSKDYQWETVDSFEVLATGDKSKIGFKAGGTPNAISAYIDDVELREVREQGPVCKRCEYGHLLIQGSCVPSCQQDIHCEYCRWGRVCARCSTGYYFNERLGLCLEDPCEEYEDWRYFKCRRCRKGRTPWNKRCI